MKQKAVNGVERLRKQPNASLRKQNLNGAKPRNRNN